MKVLVLDDGNIGNLNQSLGIVQFLPTSILKIWHLEFKGPKYKLPKRVGFYPLIPKLLGFFCFIRLYKFGKIFLFFSIKNRIFLKEKYDLVVNTGSLLSAVNLIISKSINAISIQIMLPSFVPLKEFNFLIIPYHDYLRIKNKNLKNIIVTLGSPNLIKEDILIKEGKKLESFIGKINKKIIGILIGGNDQNYRIDKECVDKIISIIEKLKNEFDFLVTVSKRTDKKVSEYLFHKLKNMEEVKYFEIPQKNSPSYYKGILSLSDTILVTEDSINMISEALTSGKNVFVLGVKRRKNKKLIFDFTLEEMQNKGYINYFPYERIQEIDLKIEKCEKRKFFNEAQICAQKILARLS